jgi:3-dehydroquinate dehydratase-2
MNRKILLLNGPNLNLLGTRKPNVYGATTLNEVVHEVQSRAADLGFDVVSFQSNSEGAIIDAIHESRATCAGIIFNPGAYTHTSIAIRDAIEAVEVPVVEVHISNIHKREAFRHRSFVSEVAVGVIAGCGVYGYILALNALVHLLKDGQ